MYKVRAWTKDTRQKLFQWRPPVCFPAHWISNCDLLLREERFCSDICQCDNYSHHTALNEHFALNLPRINDSFLPWQQTHPSRERIRLLTRMVTIDNAALKPSALQ